MVIERLVGDMTSAEFLDYVRGELARTLPWRQRLPCHGRMARLTEACRSIFAVLGRDLLERLEDDTVLSRYLENRGGAGA